MRKGNSFKQRCVSIVAVAIVFALVAVVVEYTESSAASATANATANVVTPITIAKNTDLRFGKFSPGITTGTVLIATGGGRTATGGVSLSALDAGGAASFTVTGDTVATYAITLPTNGTVTITNGANSMAVNDFVSNPSGTGTLTAGTQNLSVGATLSVGANQAAGSYTGTFQVSVDYN